MARVRTHVLRAAAAVCLAAGIGAGVSGAAYADPIEIDGLVPLTTVPVSALSTLFISGDLTAADSVDLVGVQPTLPQPVIPVNLAFNGTGQLSGSLLNGGIEHSLINATAPTGISGADTILEIGAAVMLNNIGDSATTDIQVVALNLQGTNAIEIDFGAGSQFFDVFVMLDPNVTQPFGSVTFTRTGEGSGTYQYTIPQALLLTFVEVGNESNSFSGFGDTTIVGEGTFSDAVPAPGMSFLIAGALGLLAWRRRQTLRSVPVR